MQILSIKCSNVFMFKDLYVDFTYNKKIMHPLAQNDALECAPKIYVRRNMIVLGGNATGKTTFGKLLCRVCNYLICREYDTTENLGKIVYDKEKPAFFELEFVCSNKAYLLRSDFDRESILSETLKVAELRKSYNITYLRQRLAETKTVDSVTLPQRFDEAGSVSLVLKKSENSALLAEIRKSFGFQFKISDFVNEDVKSSNIANLNTVNLLLPKIDNSVKAVFQLKTEENSGVDVQSYEIVFQNGDHETIRNGNLRTKDNRDRLSHGTYEALAYLDVLCDVSQCKSGTVFYIDEQLAHLHAELESYLIFKTCHINFGRNQLFFTTHNAELFDMNLPNNAFLLFKRDADGFNTAFFVNQKFNKNDRNLRNYYENDYFGVLPDYSDLDDSFENLFFNGNKL